jgi:MoxR-like ATPase
MSTRDQILQLTQRMGESIIGQEQVIERLLLTLPANSNLLLEGLPGPAKTRVVKSLARHLESEFRRIQFTPDLLPDVRAIVHDCLRHRFILSYEANADGLSADDVINEVVKQVAVA